MIVLSSPSSKRNPHHCAVGDGDFVSPPAAPAPSPPAPPPQSHTRPPPRPRRRPRPARRPPVDPPARPLGGGRYAAGGCGGRAAGGSVASSGAGRWSAPRVAGGLGGWGRCRRAVLARCLHLYRLVFTSVSAGVYICNRWRRWWVAVGMRMPVAPVKYYGGFPPLPSSSPAALHPLLLLRVHLPEKDPCTHPPAPNHLLGIVSPRYLLRYSSLSATIFLRISDFFVSLHRIYICILFCLTLKICLLWEKLLVL